MTEISASPISAPESGSGTSYVVRLSEASATEVTVRMILLNGTADVVNDVDYDFGSAVRQTQDLTFAPGETTKTVFLEHNTNEVGEDDESYVVEFINPVGATFTGGQDTLRITNVIEDTGLAIFVTDPRLLEGNKGQKTAIFEVRLSAPSSEQVILDYTTRDETAKAGEDYVAQSGVLTFEPGETVKRVEVPIIGDRIPEISETFSLFVTPSDDDPGAVARPWVDATGQALLIDEDTAQGGPVLTVEDVQGIESGAGEKILVRLSEPSLQDVTFTATLRSGTADTSSDVDFDFGSAVRTTVDVTIPAGNTTAQIFLEHNANTDTADESYTVELTGITGAVFAGDSDSLVANGTITGDGRSVFVDNPRVFEGDEGKTIAQFEVRISEPSEDRLVFDYNTLDGTAVGGEDFVDIDGRLVFLPGETVKYIDVELFGDRDLESEESFSVRLDATPSTEAQLSGFIESNIGTMSIRNDDRIETVITGTRRDDLLRGKDDDERLIGKRGDDDLRGRAGDDELFGGAGDDILKGGAGADLIDGGGGFDLADYSSSDARVVANLRNKQVSGGEAEGDTITDIEGIIGTEFNDLLTGSGEVDRFDGDAGNDRIKGVNGDDILNGGEGRDFIKGGKGNDIISGGEGDDRLFGEGGADVFVFEGNGGRDRIAAFNVNRDTLQIDDDIIGNASDAADLVDRFARERGDNLLLKLKDGTSILLLDFDDEAALAAAIDIF